MAYEQTASSTLDALPAHVPPDRVVDFDYVDPPGVGEDPHLAWKRLHDGKDIFYSPHNGGHWVLTRADDMFAVMHDTETFSSREFTVPKRTPGNPVLMPNQLDPPVHGPIRSTVLRPLAPKSVEPLEPIIRKIMAERIATFAGNGACEFVSAFSADIPPEIFFEHARIPKDRLAVMKRYADTVAGISTEAEKLAARKNAAAYMVELLDERRASDDLGDDIFSVLVRAERDGRLTRDETTSVALNVFFGGLETVSSALAFIILFLARNPGHRRQLIENPALSIDATEEFLRRFGILNLARLCARDTVFKGVKFAAGDLVLLPLHLANLDERKFPDALTVDFRRKQSAHMNFGTGPHRCLGSNLARPEVRIFLEEWLKQIPEFEVDPDDRPIGRSGVAMTMTRVPLVWPARAYREAAE